MTMPDPFSPTADSRTRPRVVIVGGGFGGLQAARGLHRANADVVVVDRTNHHLFQPLLYQVSTALLAPGDIAPALRSILAGNHNTQVVLGEAGSIDADSRTLDVTTADGQTRSLAYDYLVVAAGATNSFFGHDDWAKVVAPMKSVDEAVDLRSKLLKAFEIASVTPDEATRRQWLTFVVVGAGPTGVEIAGQLAALARRTLRREFRDIDPAALRIILLDAGDKVLAPFAPSLRDHASRRLERIGVEIKLGQAASAVDPDGITVTASSDGGRGQRIQSRTVVWAAGVKPVPLAARLAEATGALTDSKSRIQVGEDCAIPGHPEIFAIGDLANVHDLPGLAEPAMQEGRHVAKVIRHRLGQAADPGPFRYRDLGTMATISPLDAVAQVGPLKLHGPIGKAAWAAVHLAFLVGWGNRVAVLANWARVLTSGSRRHQLVLSQPTSQRLRADRD